MRGRSLTIIYWWLKCRSTLVTKVQGPIYQVTSSLSVMDLPGEVISRTCPAEPQNEF